MEEWNNVPVFGTRPELGCVIRPSAYGLCAGEHGRLAVVRTARGTYLPGGGIDADESPEDAIAREAREEGGLILRVGVWRIRALQFVYSEPEQTHYEKRSTFIDCAVDGPGVPVLETDHELMWLSPQLAHDRLSHESQRWAVRCWAIKSGSG